ncbi:RibD family protein [Sphingomonas sp. CCH5-D11]|uniref:RibD family protein n=1 Tax=Sphingomonas sp. CCH5-D11 TaxID=1768786 RepID=UPI0008327D0D|nr:RibD family protein [Sphingomonas sp. CCH5-D11]
MKPLVICHMMSSLDGRQHPSRFTMSPDGERRDWSALYERVHEDLAGDAWMVGRVTMAEMSKAGPHAPVAPGRVERPVHVARAAQSYAVAIDRSGKLHFDGDAIGGDHVIVLLGHDVPDSHLAELSADGVSYIVAPDDDMDLAAMLETLAERFGIRRLLLEGGGTINGSLLAAGLVDELSVLIAPALDGGTQTQGFVAHGTGGLAGMVQLSLIEARTLEHGTVHLRYRVRRPD